MSAAVASRYLVCHALSPAQQAQAVAVGVPELAKAVGKVKPGPADELVIVSRAPWSAFADLEVTRKAWATAGARVRVVPLSEWLATPVTRPPPRPAPVAKVAEPVEPAPVEPARPPRRPPPVITQGPPITAERLPEQFPYPGTFRSVPTPLYHYDIAEMGGWVTGTSRHPGDCAICGGHVSGYGQVRWGCGQKYAAHTICLRTAKADLACVSALISRVSAGGAEQQKANRLVLGGRLRWYRVGRRVVLALPEWGAR